VAPHRLGRQLHCLGSDRWVALGRGKEALCGCSRVRCDEAGRSSRRDRLSVQDTPPTRAHSALPFHPTKQQVPVKFTSSLVYYVTNNPHSVCGHVVRVGVARECVHVSVWACARVDGQ
jgi:hypothetical protein